MKKAKVFGAYFVIFLTIGLFIYYSLKHPELWKQLSSVNIFTILALFGLYILFMGSLILILQSTLVLCRVNMKPKENLLLTSYSAIINFFGPLQSGPGFRAVYLKSKHGLKIKNFIMASLVYYLFFGVISLAFAAFASAYWRWGFLLIPGLAVAFYIFYRKEKNNPEIKSYSFKNVSRLGLATFIQLIIVSIIYFVELKSVNSHVSLHQAIAYTGIANLALFVSLTPGAIGIREAFLLLSQRIHHLPKTSIIAASLLDRGIYIVFLAVLFIIALSFNFKEKIGIKVFRPKVPDNT